MAIKSKGRGTAGAFGMLLLLVGLAGAAVLWVMSIQRPDRAVDDFARAPVGCTVTLEFSDTGTFFVYREQVAADNEVFDSCEPVATDGVPFGFDLVADRRKVAVRDDTSISYDTDTAVGTSVARVEIVTPGRYELVVRGDEPSVVAAVGRAPDDGVSTLRRGAIAVGVVGVVLGGLMLLLAGRRSSKAAKYAVPEGPGWGPEQRAVPSGAAWPPEPPRLRQVPINPLLPSDTDEPTASGVIGLESGTADSGPSTSPGRPAAPESETAMSPWAPPADGTAPVPLPPPTQGSAPDSVPSSDR